MIYSTPAIKRCKNFHKKYFKIFTQVQAHDFKDSMFNKIFVTVYR